jgi:adenylate cyclase
MQGWASADRDPAGPGIEQMRRGLEDYRATGATLWAPCYLTPLAQLYVRAGDVAQGLEIQADALAAVRWTGGSWFEAEAYRQKGELLLANGHGAEDGEDCLRHALGVAREQKARFWELRAAAALARSKATQGLEEEAVNVLAHVIAWFSEGPDLADLQEGKTLMDGLRRGVPAS